MARLSPMTPEEIARAIEAGAEKRAARKAKRQEKMRELEKAKLRHMEETLGLPDDFEEKLRLTWSQLERVYYKYNRMSPDLAATAKAFFFSLSSDFYRFKVYHKFFHDYESLIAYAWMVSDELCDAAFKFWDSILQYPEAEVSANVIIRILGSKPNQNLLTIIQRHHEVLIDNVGFKPVLKNLIDRYLSEPGLWDFKTQSFDPWTPEEKKILQEIQKFF